MYLSKGLDLVTARWQTCIKAIAATAQLVKEADRLTLGQELFLTAPTFCWDPLRESTWENRCLTPTDLGFGSTRHQTSTMPLSCQTMTPTGPRQDCLEVTDPIQSVRPDKTDDPLVTPDKVLLSDGSSFTKNGIRYVGAVVATQDYWTHSLRRRTLAQWAELLALMQVLHWGKDITIYTNRQYAFAMTHVHGAQYRKQEW